MSPYWLLVYEFETSFDFSSRRSWGIKKFVSVVVDVDDPEVDFVVAHCFDRMLDRISEINIRYVVSSIVSNNIGIIWRKFGD